MSQLFTEIAIFVTEMRIHHTLTTWLHLLLVGYDTIRDVILTCARKPTWISLIYRTQPTTKKCKNRKTKSRKQICSEITVNSPGNPWLCVNDIHIFYSPDPSLNQIRVGSRVHPDSNPDAWRFLCCSRESCKSIEYLTLRCKQTENMASDGEEGSQFISIFIQR